MIKIEIEVKDLDGFITFLKGNSKIMLNRGYLINLLSPISENWSYALRSLLICSSSRSIGTDYILEKSVYIKNGRGIKDILDYWRYKVYEIIKEHLDKEKEIKALTLKENDSFSKVLESVEKVFMASNDKLAKIK